MFGTTVDFEAPNMISEEKLVQDHKENETQKPAHEIVGLLNVNSTTKEQTNIQQQIDNLGIHEKVYFPGGINYGKLTEQFGSQLIDNEIIAKIEKITKRPAHVLLRRGIFFSHRDLQILLDAHENGTPFYVYTGRGPSSASMHIGHLIPFMFTQYLQEAFNVPVVIQMTDDEKYLHKENLSLEECTKFTKENIKDVIACGFNPQKTFIFSNFSYINHLYPNVVKIQKYVTNSQVKGIFGVKNDDNIGKTAFPALQAAPSFYTSFPLLLNTTASQKPMCLIPCGIDQDPYFRMTRDVAPRLGYAKPALIHSKFLPSLQGMEGKMSSDNAVFLTDSKADIKRKINKAFSGGQDNIEAHRLLGANLEIDVSYQYLYALLDNDQEMNDITVNYKSGKLLSGQVKKRTIDLFIQIVEEHKAKRIGITDEILEQFTTIHPLF